MVVTAGTRLGQGRGGEGNVYPPGHSQGMDHDIKPNREATFRPGLRPEGMAPSGQSG